LIGCTIDPLINHEARIHHDSGFGLSNWLAREIQKRRMGLARFLRDDRNRQSARHGPKGISAVSHNGHATLT
jgi:hypothetical protein